jgi:hypothetical protein
MTSMLDPDAADHPLFRAGLSPAAKVAPRGAQGLRPKTTYELYPFHSALRHSVHLNRNL